MQEWLTVESLSAFATLSLMEIVLGVDNIVFISILVARLPEALRPKARKLGLMMAFLMRLLLLFSISWIMRLTEPFTEIFGWSVSGKSLILVLGGLFLVAKATYEIHHKLEDEADLISGGLVIKASFASILLQITLLDIVFSLDSVITAVGMVKELYIMIGAMCVAMLVMLISANSIGKFVDKHPTVKILALSFLILIGVMLMAEGIGNHIPKGYIYFAMAFSLGVEVINLKVRSKNKSAKMT